MQTEVQRVKAATQLDVQVCGPQPAGARPLTPPPSQVMATPRRAAPSSTAPTQRRGRSMMARTWPCLRWVARGVGPPPTVHLPLRQPPPPSFPGEQSPPLHLSLRSTFLPEPPCHFFSSPFPLLSPFSPQPPLSLFSLLSSSLLISS